MPRHHRLLRLAPHLNFYSCFSIFADVKPGGAGSYFPLKGAGLSALGIAQPFYQPTPWPFVYVQDWPDSRGSEVLSSSFVLF